MKEMSVNVDVECVENKVRKTKSITFHKDTPVVGWREFCKFDELISKKNWLTAKFSKTSVTFIATINISYIRDYEWNRISKEGWNDKKKFKKYNYNNCFES